MCNSALAMLLVPVLVPELLSGHARMLQSPTLHVLIFGEAHDARKIRRINMRAKHWLLRFGVVSRYQIYLDLTVVNGKRYQLDARNPGEIFKDRRICHEVVEQPGVVEAASDCIAVGILLRHHEALLSEDFNDSPELLQARFRQELTGSEIPTFEAQCSSSPDV